MARKSMSYKQHAKKFSRARKRSKVINSPSVVMRGGIRL